MIATKDNRALPAVLAIFWAGFACCPDRRNAMAESHGADPRRLLWKPSCCLVLLLAFLGAGAVRSDDSSGRPEILLFRVLPTIDDGVHWHEFHWQVANTYRVRLFQDGSELHGRTQLSDGSLGWQMSMSGSMRMRLKVTATFQLVAEDQAGKSVSARQVAEVQAADELNKPPDSQGLCAEGSEATCRSRRAACDVLKGTDGSSTEVCRWDFAESSPICSKVGGIWITPGSRYGQRHPGAVPRGKVGVCITELANIASHQGQSPADLSSPTIKSFRVVPATAKPGDEIGFYWEVEDGKSVRLFEGDHAIDLRGLEDALSTGGRAGLSTTIDETTTFRLEALGQNRTVTSASVTVVVEAAAEPAGKCEIRGQLNGKWRQEIREHPTGPASSWTVAVYVYATGSNQPIGNASVDNQGVYRVRDLTGGKRYRLRPNWDSVPREGNVSCSPGQIQRGPGFRITGSPRID